jgi:ABC-type transport system substrate-binding protein/DNA-binding SARP family transcriptional activator
VKVAILGPLQVTADGAPIEIRRPKERALLTVLAASVGSAVSSDRLIDGIWGEHPPPTAIKALRNYIHHLRSLLPADSIKTEGSAYQLRVEPDDVDARRFAAEVARARSALDTQPAAAIPVLQRALEMWRGVPFEDADLAEFLVPQRARLDATLVQAQADLNDALIRSGREEDALLDLRSLVEEHPLREDLWGLYMIALYRTGRQAAALRAFGEARRVLAEQLGIDPGPELRRLEALVLAQDAELNPPSHAEKPSADSDPASREPVAAAGERRLVTLVLARLEQTGSLEAAAGADRANIVSAEGLAAMASTLERFGGTVTHQDGTQVVALFGVPVARETDTYRAIRASLGLASELRERRAEIETSWGVEAGGARCAVRTSSVTAPLATDEELDENIEALSAMLDADPDGVVVVDDHTRRLMEDLFSWSAGTSVGDWRVRSALQTPDKARISRGLRAPLTGRAAETAVMRRHLDALRRGIGGALVIRGEAGVGKTRLISEWVEDATDVRWLTGHCAAYAETTPYWPFRDLIRSWLELGIDDTDLKARVALHHRLSTEAPSHAPDLYPYLGGVLGIELEPEQQVRLQLAPESLQYRTFEVLEELVTALADPRPVVVVIEDVHWSDPTSISVVERLLAATERIALLLVLTTRPDPDHPSHVLMETARRGFPHLTDVLDLEPLGPDDQERMLRSLIGSAVLPDQVVAAILRLAEGNPFYLEELVGSVIDQRTLSRNGAGWSVDRDRRISVPETVEKVVQARIDRLDGDAHELMTAASVLGRSFGLPVVQGLVGDRIDVMGAIHDLLRLGLLVEAQRWPQAEYLFKHALIQEASYSALTPGRRREMHRRVAEWLQSRFEARPDEVAADLARHWVGADDDEGAAVALLRAGDAARRNHALSEAIGHYQRLLPILEGRGDRRAMALVLLKLALTQHTSLRFGESSSTYRRAFELWDPKPSPPATATLRYRSSSWFEIPDPVRSYALQDIQLQMALFDRLVERWPDDTIVPSLAERWEISEDGLRYEFTLREGLVWSDGHPLSAHDVEFGFLRNLDPERPGISSGMLHVLVGALEHVTGSSNADTVGVRALDDRTVEFRLLAPAPYFLGMLNRPDCGPQPRHAIEALGDSWGDIENEVVSGAFHRTRQTDDEITLERRGQYAGTRLGNVRVVEWATGLQAETVRGFETGEADLAWGLGSWNGSDLERLPAESITYHPTAGLLYLVFNHRNPLVADPRFRRALAHGLDRAAIEDLLPDHMTAATGGMVPPALAGHTPDIVLPFDPVAGKSLLGEIGGDPVVRVLALDVPGYSYDLLASVAVDMWSAHLGIVATVTSMTRDEWFALDALPGDIHAFPSWWYPGYTDAEYFLRLLLHSDGPDNEGRFSNQDFDRLIEQAVRETEERARLELFHEADRMAVRDLAAAIPMAYSQQFSLIRDGVEGWWEFGKSWANFADLTVDARVK